MMMTLCMRLAILLDRGEATLGMIARAKATCSSNGRVVCALARECCGGNGIVLERHVMKAFMDAETIHTYEGSYDINSLVSGREITGGLNAFV